LESYFVGGEFGEAEEELECDTFGGWALGVTDCGEDELYEDYECAGGWWWF